MRIVYVLPFLSLPPRDGLSIRVWHTLTTLGARHDIHLVLPERAVKADLTASLTPLVKSITGFPEPAEGRARRGSTRWDTVKDALTYPPTLFRVPEQYPLAECVRQLLGQGTDVDWLLCETQLTAHIALLPGFPRVRRCLSLHDLYTEYTIRKVRATPWRPYKAKLAVDVLKIRTYESRIMRHFDLVTVVNPEEERIVRARTGSAQVALLPNGVDAEYFRPLPSEPPTESNGPPTMLFVGNLSYEPNQDAVRYFLSDIFPIVRRTHPSARLLVVGKDPPLWLRAAGGEDTGVTVTGTVEDVRPFYGAANVVVAPLRLGGGTKLKVLEALAMGKPVVATPAGAWGLSLSHGLHLLVGDDPAEFAHQVTRVLDNSTLAGDLGAAGRQVVEDEYAWSRILPRLEEILDRGAGRSESRPGLVALRG